MVERYRMTGYDFGTEPYSDGAWVTYHAYADLERQIAELRAERDAAVEREREKSQMLAIETHHAEAAEAENARLRALPLKDEVERELADIEENLDDAVQYLVDLAGAKPSPMSPHNCRIYIDHARMGARNLAALLSRLRAGEQEGCE